MIRRNIIISIYTGFFLARAHVKANRMASEGHSNTIMAAMPEKLKPH